VNVGEVVAPVHILAVDDFRLLPPARRRRSASAAKFAAGDDGAPAFEPQVDTLYVRKSALPGGKIPKTLIVTIVSA